ncbi:MAG TPA: hypothetical protein VM938_04085 [Acidimicrobiales bacterium]|nr:hypothetical protein [Acidimicrobiales bacterium]
MMQHMLLAALQWDPHIRGGLIVLTSVAILCGSVYLLLATNVGARLGFLLAVAGLTGWMFLMSIIWMVFGIGLKGRPNTWVTQEIITGNVSQSTIEKMAGFPNGWTQLNTGDAGLADVQAATDQALAPSEIIPHSAHGTHSKPEEPEFPPPFKTTTDYVFQTAYRVGGDNELFTIGKHKFYFRHSPHYAVVTVQPSVKPTPKNTKPVADLSKPAVTVVMLRDLGSVRVPPFIMALATGTIFFVTCYALHQRDKEIMRQRAATAAAA